MSVGMPSWRELIEHMLADLQLDAGVMASPEISYQIVAEYYRVKRGGIDQLGDWMKSNWRVDEDQIRTSKLHELIVRLGFPLIYTTNYDSNLEAAFSIHGRPYKKVTRVSDFAAADASATLIVKYHGDFDDMSSLILTETDFFDRLSFEAPLDVRFRSDALTASMLFIGYSMSDINIRLLLHRLWSTWRRAGQENARPRSYIFLHDPSPIQRAILENWGLTVLAGAGCSPEDSLIRLLEELHSLTG